MQLEVTVNMETIWHHFKIGNQISGKDELFQSLGRLGSDIRLDIGESGAISYMGQ